MTLSQLSLTSPSKPALRILLIEDSEDDALLIVREIRHGGYEVTWDRVDTAPALASAMQQQSWDLITCDWLLPGFSAPAALAMLRDQGVSAPIIIVSGEVGEEVAVTGIKAGAHDYVSKQNLIRLVPAIARGLREAEERRARLQAEAALRASEERFRSVIQNAPDLIAIIDAAGKYRYVNPAHERVYGVTVAALTGSDAFDTLHPDDARELMPRLAEAMRSGEKMATVEYRIRHRNGTWHHVEGIALNMFDDPVVAGLFVTGRDITARKLREAVIRENQQRLEVGVRVADIAVFNQDRDLRYTWMYHPQLGYTPEQVVGKTDSELLPRAAAEPVTAIKRNVVDTGAATRDEIRVESNGRTFTFDLIVEPLRDDTGAIIGLTGASHDITEYKHTEELLHTHIARLEVLHDIHRALLDGQPIPDVVRAALDRIRAVIPSDFVVALLFNHEAGQAEVIASIADAGPPLAPAAYVPLAGFSPVSVLLERRVICIDDLRDTTEPRAPVLQLPRDAGMRSLLTAGLINEGEALGILSFGSARPAAFTADHQGAARDVAGILAIAIHQGRLHAQLRRHTAELEQRVRQRTAELEAANNELEAFSYSVSHDLRAPLRHIEGFSRLLRETNEANLDAEGRRYLDRIHAGTEHMSELIQDLLGLSHVTRSALELKATNLTDLARTVVDDLHRNDPRRQVEFVIKPALVANVDPRLLRIVLQNLLGNAWKYTSKHATARIEFGTLAGEHTTVYFVRDDGAGFDMANLGRLFGAFQRLHSPADFEGTGVGLATVQRIIHRHGGRIWAEGAPERGATFYFTLAPDPDAQGIRLRRR
ncbi:MAG TPA: PAS domain S-box protein [Candidatus Binatia bacterium]|nr:PAS domain S-box protein [Candidatus Binatia bacterium]